MAKIDIISGFLGAGKTTLIKKLIADAFKNEKVVLIENEFGEIGIDGGFLKEAGIEITEMNSGCICCSLVGDFGEALKKVVDEYKPDRVIIEPSGVGKLSDVIKAVEKASQDVDIKLNSATTVVDVTKAKMYIKNFGEFFLNQIEACGTVVLSRSQNATEEKLVEVVNMIKEHNADARMITTPWDQIDGTIILDAIEHSSSIEDIMKNFRYNPEEDDHHHHHHYDENGVCSCGHHHDDDDDEDEHEHHHHHHDDEEEHEHHHHHHDDEDEHEHHHHHHDDEDEHEHHHHYDENGVCSCGHHHHHGHDADEVFTSWGRETALKYDETELRAILDKLAVEEDNEFGIILRAKGIIPDKSGKWLEFDLVPGEYEVREGVADYTGKLCVIGSNLAEDKIAELFGM
ncbi:GTPase, G3E family [Eubacterium ruminantium]|uniref:GTPase, G3E family n=1 Tax=Eubacterium ruminantium TaxID=42322 RepID=A0A1T4MG69_9FIRM|nr:MULTISPECIES: CobW family GTP-binding protein [Eubacterium]MCR5367848.1 GTP-binding protein [Eubacterium sp.]SCW47802.1 GTPase, G3E family [Eubacterium ruminantium]SDM56015.1 GTPase, G3E family [Eubacterium ruminantium]SJZ65865.1 GTPase, G3E family [Eubacterium ruminantium]